MNVSFVVPCRDKAAHVRRCVESVLAQNFSPMEIVLSDQGSTDGTRAILDALAAGYDGPNEIRILDCPETRYRGMAGLNAHLNWLMPQLAGEVVIMCSADDWNHPDRATHTVAAFEQHDPSYVGSRVRYVTPEGGPAGETLFPGRRSRWIEPEEAFRHLIGSSASSAWAMDLWRRHGPLDGIESQDMILPPLALAERGLWYIDLPLHHYVLHADPANTGLEGQLRAAGDDTERLRLTEVNNFHNVSNWTAVCRRLERSGLLDRFDAGARNELFRRVALSADLWAQARDAMTLLRVEPQAMRV